MRGVDIAAGVEIAGITGRNGVGKTLVGVAMMIERMRAGRVVYSTVQIDYTDPKTGVVYSSKPVRSLRELLSLEDCTVFLDEVSVIFSSRSTNSLPNEAVTWLQTLRHKGETGVDVLWSAPAWMRCDNLLREVTKGVIGVRPFFQKTVGLSPWRVPRLIRAELYDTSVGKADAAPTEKLRGVWLRPTKLRSWGAYDTHASTPHLGASPMTGVCVDCGGTMPRPKHSRELHELLDIPWYGDGPEIAHEHEKPHFEPSNDERSDVSRDGRQEASEFDSLISGHV